MQPSAPQLLRALITSAALLCATLTATAEPQETQRRVQFNKGIVAFNQGDFSLAETTFEQLVAEDSEDAGALYWLGLCRLQSNKYTQAGEAFQNVLQLAPERVEVQLDYAIALVGQENFTAGRDVLREFIDGEAGDEATRTQAYFFLGVTEYKTENYEAALAALEQAEAGTTQPNMLANIAWYRSWVYTEQRKFDEASAEFQRVGELSTNVDQQVRARALADQVATGVIQEPGASAFEFRVDLGFTFDSNVILLGDSASRPIEYATEDDFRFGLSTDVRYLAPFADNWLLGVGGSTFNSWHASLQEFNVQTYGGRIFLNQFASERVTYGFQTQYDYTLVENDPFLARTRLTPSVRLIESFHDDGSTLTATTLFYSYENRNYHEELDDLREDRDGNYHSLGFVQSFNFSRPRIDDGDERWLSGSIGYRFLNESTQGDDFDMDGHVLSARLGVPLKSDWWFEFAGMWTWEDYWQPNTQDYKLRERSDFVQRYIFSVRRAFELDSHVDMELSGMLGYQIDDSNVRNRLGEAVYSYDRLIVGVTFSFWFH